MSLHLLQKVGVNAISLNAQVKETGQKAGGWWWVPQDEIDAKSMEIACPHRLTSK